MTTTDLTKLTPVEIDTRLAGLFDTEATVAYHFKCANEARTRYRQQAKDLHERFPDKYPTDYRPYGLDATEAEACRYIERLAEARHDRVGLDRGDYYIDPPIREE